MLDQAKRFLREESAQGMTEYALILALVALVACSLLAVLGGHVSSLFNKVVDAFTPQGEEAPI